MNRKWVIIILSAVIPVAAIAGTVSTLKLGKDSIKYRTAKVERGDITAVVTASGTLHPLLTVQVGSQVSGIIKELYADFESVVKAGELLARLDPAPFEKKVNQARANLEMARAKLTNTSAEVIKVDVKMKDAERTYRRFESLFKSGAVTEQERDTALTNYEIARAESEATKAGHELAQAELKQSEAALESAELDLSHTYIYSPVDGVVLTRNVDVGQTVAATFQTPTFFTIAQDLTEMEAHLDVNEADIGRINLGQPATFYVNAYPDQTFNAEVVEIRSSPKVTQNVVTYDVVIRIDNKELELRPGMTANATVIVAERRNVLRLPNAALRFKPPAPPKKDEKNRDEPRQRDGKGREQPHVYILAGKARLKALPVETGATDDNFTELLSGDVKEGDPVVVGAIARARPPETPRRLF